MENLEKRAPGRPRTFDREKALATAVDLFWRHGYDGTSIAQLTDAMKISAPSLYAAFGSKEQLHREAIDLYLSTHGNYMSRSFAQPGSTRDAIERVLKDAAKAFSQPGLPQGCLVGSGALHCALENASVGHDMTSIRKHTRDTIHARIKQAMVAGELPPDTDAKALAAFFAATVQGMSVQAIDGASRPLLNRIAEIAMAAWPDGASAGSSRMSKLG